MDGALVLAVAQLWSRYWIARCLMETGLLACMFYVLSGPSFEHMRPAFADKPLRDYRMAVHEAAEDVMFAFDSGPVQVMTLRIERMRRQYIDDKLKLELPR